MRLPPRIVVLALVVGSLAGLWGCLTLGRIRWELPRAGVTAPATPTSPLSLGTLAAGALSGREGVWLLCCTWGNPTEPILQPCGEGTSVGENSTMGMGPPALAPHPAYTTWLGDEPSGWALSEFFPMRKRKWFLEPLHWGIVGYKVVDNWHPAWDLGADEWLCEIITTLPSSPAALRELVSKFHG